MNINNQKRRTFRPRQNKTGFRPRSNGPRPNNNGHFQGNNGNNNFSRNGSMTNPFNVEKAIQKYQQLAQDSQSSGDPVLIENYLQHADHFTRRLAELNSKNKPINNNIDQAPETSDEKIKSSTDSVVKNDESLEKTKSSTDSVVKNDESLKKTD